MHGRVYGADYDDPGPRDGRLYAELAGGPLDGLLLDVTDRCGTEQEAGAGLPTEMGRYGAGGRSLYVPRAEDASVFDWKGDVP